MRKRRQIELAAALLFSHFDPYFSATYVVNAKWKNWIFNAENRLKRRIFKVFWSECGDSNHGSPASKEMLNTFFACLYRFLAISCLFCLLFDALISAVSGCSTPVCSQTCGQKPLSEHPRDRGQKAVFHSLPECRGRMLRRSGLPHCTSAGEVKQVLYAGTGGAEFASQ